VGERARRLLRRRLRLLAFGLSVIGAVPAVALAAAPAGWPGVHSIAGARTRSPMASLSGWLSPTVAFPERDLVLRTTARRALSVSRVHISENGQTIHPSRLTRLSAPAPGDLGVMFVIQRSASMGGGGLAAAVSAARAIGTSKPGNERFGAIAFAARPSVLLGLTTDRRAIDRRLRTTPAVDSAACNVAAATQQALARLAAAKTRLGVVVVISDGVGGAERTSGPTAATVRAAAARADAPVITVGLRDERATTASLTALAHSAPGSFVLSSEGRLSSTLTSTLRTVADRHYVLGYRSHAPAGSSVAITAVASGLSGQLNASYRVPGIAPTPPSRPQPSAGASAPTPSAPRPAAPTSAPASRSATPPSSSGTPPPSTTRAPSPPSTTRAPSPASTTRSRSPQASSRGIPGSKSGTPGRPAATSGPTAPVGPSAAGGRDPSTDAPHLVGEPEPNFGRELPPSPMRTTSFWSSGVAVPAVAIVCALLGALALWFVLRRPQGATVRARVGNFLPIGGGNDGAEAPSPSRRSRLLGSLERGSWWPTFVEAVEISRNPRPPMSLVKRAAAGGMVAGLLLGLISGSVLAALAPLLLWPFVLRALVLRAARKQRDRFRDTLPGYLQDMASAIRVGRSFAGALAAVASDAEEPTRSELERAATDEALGRPLEESLEAVGRRMLCPDMDQVALVAELNRRSGSNVAEALDRVADGARERTDLRREMGALTAQAKMSSSVLTALPVVVLMGLVLLAPSYAHPLLHSTMGFVVLLFGAGLIASGWKVMKKITNIEA